MSEDIRSTPIRRRNRSAETSERRRRGAHADGKCITCGAACATWRCTACTRDLEQKTERYRGRGFRGGTSKNAMDAVDLRVGFEELGRAIVEMAAVEQLGLPARRREQALASPLARLALVSKAVREVQRRHRAAVAKLEAPPVVRRRPPQLAFSFVSWPEYMGAR